MTESSVADDEMCPRVGSDCAEPETSPDELIVGEWKMYEVLFQGTSNVVTTDERLRFDAGGNLDIVLGGAVAVSIQWTLQGATLQFLNPNVDPPYEVQHTAEVTADHLTIKRGDKADSTELYRRVTGGD